MKNRPTKTAGGVRILCRYDRLVPADDLDPHPKNYRIHPPAKQKLLRRTITKNGWRRPVVVSRQSGCITKGHCAWLSAKKSGDEVPVEDQDYASTAEEEADLVADNKAGEGSEDDDAKLMEIIRDLGGKTADPDVLGVGAEEFDKMLSWLDPDREPRKRTPKSTEWKVVFDDAEQKDAWLSFMNRLKADSGEDTSAGARLIALAERTGI